jgi:two-component system chemotaxis response regulator CheB
VVTLSDSPPVNRHRPSVDVLFRSAVTEFGPNALGILLTGMGTDGAGGLADLYHVGAETFAQDEATSVVFGMPAAAVKLGAVTRVLPLQHIAEQIVRWAG